MLGLTPLRLVVVGFLLLAIIPAESRPVWEYTPERIAEEAELIVVG